MREASRLAILEPLRVPFLNLPSARRGLSALVLSVAGLVAVAPSFAANADPSEQLQPALSLEGNYLSAYVAGVARDTEAASAFYRQAIDEDPRNQELLERGFVAFLANGSMQDAFRAAERLASRDPSNSLAQFTLAVRAIKAGRFADARAALGKGARGRQADITATLLSAWAQAGQKNGKGALQTVDRLRNEQAFTQFREYHAALIAQLTGNVPEAEKRFKAAYEGERNTLQVVDAYARFEARRGRKDEALSIYKTFEEAMPRHPVVRSSVDAIKAGRTLPVTVTSAQEGASEVLYGLGVVGSGQGDELTAVIYLRLGLYLNPEHPLALVTLGDLYEKLKQYERANEIFARVPKEAPVRPSADIAIGQNLELDGPGRRGRDLSREAPEGASRRRRGRHGARQRTTLPQAVRGGRRDLRQGDPTRGEPGARALDPVLLPRHLLRARQGVGQGPGRPQEVHGTRARQPAGRKSPGPELPRL